MSYEKVSVNVNDELLTVIDLLVEEGFYPNRSDFIQQAIGEKASSERKTIDKLLEMQREAESIEENQWFIGVAGFGKDYLMRVKEQGKRLRIRGFGVMSFSKGVDDQLVFDTIESISRKIRIHGSEAVVRHFRPEKFR